MLYLLLVANLEGCGCEGFGFALLSTDKNRIMKKSAIAIIFNQKKNAIVLVKRRDVPVWVLPGGGIDDNETPEAAAVREAQEETGLTVKIERQVAEYSPINRLASQTYTYQCEVLDGNLSTGPETQEIQWFSLGNLPPSFFHIHHEWLLDALKNESSPIYRNLDSVTYWGVLVYFLKHPFHVVRILLSRFGFPLNSKSKH